MLFTIKFINDLNLFKLILIYLIIILIKIFAEYIMHFNY